MNIAVLKNWIEPFYELLKSGAPFKYRLMRFFGRIPHVRRRYFKKNGQITIPEAPFEKLQINGSIQDTINSLNENGLADDISVDRGFLNYLLNFSASTPFINRATSSGKYAIDPAHLINPGEGYIYSIMNPHELDQSIMNFVTREVKPIADAYLNANAYLLNTQIWATFWDERDSYNPDFGFHYDLDDYRFLKLFVYLSDVDEDCGPHEIIVGSHNKRHLFRFFNRRLLMGNTKQTFPCVKTMMGPKGSAFFEDTLCYHRGIRPIKPRLIFQIQFGVTSSWGKPG